MDQFPDFDYSSSFDESLYDLLHSPEMEMEKATEWSFEEQKALENALAEVADPSSPAFIDNVAARVPWRSTDDIISHYQALLNDVEMIESGNVPLPNYQPHPVDAPQKQDDEVVVVVAKNNHRDEGSSSNPRSKSGHPRRRGVPWTEDEHQLFLMGLNKYGKGDWRSISRFYVITKTPTQVASHAQKYFRRVASSTPMDRRRPSIHDIQTVNPTAFPMLHHQQPFNGGGGGQLLLDQNPMFPHYPAAINYAANFNQPAPYAGPPSYAAPSSYLLPPNMMNQQHWG